MDDRSNRNHSIFPIHMQGIYELKNKAFSSLLYGTICKERNQLPLDIGESSALKEEDRRRKSMCILTTPIACTYGFR